MKQTLLYLFLIFSLLSFTDKDNESHVSVYPNPIRTKATLTCDYYVQQIEVYSFTGKMIASQVSPELDFSEQSAGYYLIKVYTPKGELVKRVYKE